MPSPPPKAARHGSHGHPHIAQALQAVALRRCQQITTVCEGRARSGRQMCCHVAALSRGLRSMGLRCGDRVAIAALNSEWYLDWLLAVPSAGGIVAPLNHRWSVEEAGEAIRRIGASVLILDSECLPWWEKLSASCPTLQSAVFIGEARACDFSGSKIVTMESVVESGGGLFSQNLELFWAPRGIAVICFTSGTTGAPKGAALSHTALVVQSLAKIAAVGYNDCDTFLHAAPLCHIGGISSALSMLMAGGAHIFLPRFRIETVTAAVTEHHVTALIAVPTMLANLIMPPGNGEERAAPKFSHVRTLLVGGGAMGPALARAVEESFPSARIMSAYGEALYHISTFPVKFL